MTIPLYCLVDFEPPGLRVTVKIGDSLLEAARKAGITLWSGCGGQGYCGQCRVIIIAGQVSAITDDEFECLTEAELRNHRRLVCCVRIYSATRVFIPDTAFHPPNV